MKIKFKKYDDGFDPTTNFGLIEELFERIGDDSSIRYYFEENIEIDNNKTYNKYYNSIIKNIRNPLAFLVGNSVRFQIITHLVDKYNLPENDERDLIN